MILAIETSCDETSVAVVHEGRILSNIVSSQIALHAEYGGVVPELAAREHLKNFPSVTQRALAEAGVSPADIHAVAATQGPGLPTALLIGFKAAQAIAFALRKPFIGINHHEAHLYSPWIGDFDSFQPNVSLIVSGGHTILTRVDSESKHQVLGSTLDDAAGECFDKTGKLIGLPYPAGPEMDKLAELGDAKAFDFPRPLINDPGNDFSFSGLKTSVRYCLRDHPNLLADSKKIRDLCASIQAAIVDVLVNRTMRAAERVGARCVTASGGVTCNSALRRELGKACKKAGTILRLAEKQYCTDNAAMIGILAERKLRAGTVATPLDSEIEPGMAL
ncbi:MAG TPA: tRNA (adenosine(37)-N6)-threonylcarbamoyltransferase complex transferase subunit TsaD [Verrucomicrobiae bacterium]|nr:tRNA (adenosine(37)-N6)-threonylcarbamoyltransferase complex transferase subunit TsaD [Verrucomicrobiae bacterium]